MSKVSVTKDKLDILANAIANKSGEPLTLTLDEMVSAVDGIETGGITPTGNIDITQAGVTDVTNYATATVPSADPFVTTNRWYSTDSGGRKYNIQPWIVFDDDGDIFGTAGWIDTNTSGDSVQFNAIPKNTTVTPTTSSQTIGGANYMMEGAVTVNAVPSVGTWESVLTGDFQTINNKRYWRPNNGIIVFANQDGWIEAGTYTETDNFNAVASGTSVTPTESAQTIGGANYMMEGAVTVSAIPSNYVGSGITQRSSSDLTVSGATVTAPSGYYSASASKSVASGTAGTPTATKGTVSNHAVSVTPSVTNTTGYITGGTKSGTAVSVSASELVSGTLSVTENGTKDVTNYASVNVNLTFSTIYTGSGNPSSSTGVNGDIYLKVVG